MGRQGGAHTGLVVCGHNQGQDPRTWCIAQTTGPGHRQLPAPPPPPPVRTYLYGIDSLPQIGSAHTAAPLGQGVGYRGRHTTRAPARPGPGVGSGVTYALLHGKRGTWAGSCATRIEYTKGSRRGVVVAEADNGSYGQPWPTAAGRVSTKGHRVHYPRACLSSGRPAGRARARLGNMRLGRPWHYTYDGSRGQGTTFAASCMDCLLDPGMCARGGGE